MGVRKIAPGSNYNKVFELSMRDGRIVIAKVPHPNAGLPFWTTASEAATMDWVGSSLLSICLSIYLGLADEGFETG